MLKWKSLLMGGAVLGAGGYFLYNNNRPFASMCHLGYAGLNMTFIYKFGKQSLQTKHTLASQYLRDALKWNGGIYLKLGQLIATLDVIVPDEYRSTMSTLTRQCKKSTYQEVKKTIEEDLKRPIDVVFSQFEKEPISSASIAQVHRATLLNGQKVAVKVQHNNLAGRVQSDLALISKFVTIAEWIFPQFKYRWLVEEFDKNITIQLDFNQQAANMARTDHFLKENKFKNIYIPQLLLQPTKRILIMEFIEGAHLDELQKMKKMGINTKVIGQTFSKMIVKMIHKEGFVHADTHCGNLMVRKVNNKDQLVLLDHGLYQRLDASLIKNYNQFWLGLILNDPTFYEKAARNLGTTNPKLLVLMLTSKTPEDFGDPQRKLFDLNPSLNKQRIIQQAAKNHVKIIGVLNELKREILLLLKVNQFARTIENMLSGRQMGVYQDIASECVNNLGFSWYTRWRIYLRMLCS